MKQDPFFFRLRRGLACLALRVLWPECLKGVAALRHHASDCYWMNVPDVMTPGPDVVPLKAVGSEPSAYYAGELRAYGVVLDAFGLNRDEI